MARLYKRKGGDVLVNTATTGNQNGANIAILQGGGYIVTWTDASLIGGDASGLAIKAQRFDAEGNPVGGEFLVNTTTAGNQNGAIATGLASGRFVVTWNDASATGGDTGGSAVRGQMFEADGTPVGGEFLVNTQTANGQSAPSISALAGGGFVVTWTDASLVGGDNSGSGIKGQLFDSTGAKVGGEILINTDIAGSQGTSSVVALVGGGFAVAWQGPTTSSFFITGSVRTQVFDAAGAKVGTEQVVNSSEYGNFNTVHIAALTSGYVVTWTQQEGALSTNTFDVRGQIFDATGAKVGTEFVVNSTTGGNQGAADVDALPGGGFLATWQGPGDGLTGFNIFGQVFDENGAKLGVEFVVTSVSDGNQTAPRVEVLPSGDIVLTWTDASGTGGDASGSAVRMQILTLSNDAPTDIALSNTVISETALEGVGLAVLSTAGTLNSGYSYEILSDSSGGAFTIAGNRLVVLDNGLLDFETHPTVSIRIRATDDNGHSFEETLQLDIADTPEAGYVAVSGEFLVNTTTPDNQSEVRFVTLEGGGFVALWTQWAPFGSTFQGKGQIYDAAGDPVGGELSIGEPATAGTGLSGGGFVVVRGAPDASGFGVVLQMFDSAGAPVGSAIPVNTTTAGDQYAASITRLSNGNLVVAWDNVIQNGNGSPPTIVARAQIFDSSGATVGGELTIEGTEVVALTGGGFVVAGASGNVFAQLYTAAGVRYGPPTVVTADNAVEGHVAALSTGGFVVIYDRNISSGGFTGVDRLSAQIFDANGVPLGNPILISEAAPSLVGSISVAALPWGGFVVGWADYAGPNGEDDEIRAQVFDGSGTPIGPELAVNEISTNPQMHTRITVLESGDILIGWTDSSELGGDPEDFSVKARLFSVAEVPPPGPTPGDDVLIGTGGDDVIDALAGNDQVSGLGGNDVIDGGSGTDIMAGGEGNDIYHVDNGGDTIVELANQGRDVVYASVNWSLNAGAHVEVISAASQGGTTPLILAGNEFDQDIYGNAGNNLLQGGGGSDYLVGLGGDDQYIVVGSADRIVELVGQGRDVLYALGNYTLAAGASIEVLSTGSQSATLALELVGNELDQDIYGNAGNNLLQGGGGNDFLIGLQGDDQYIVLGNNDRVVEIAGQGRDVVYTMGDYTLDVTVSVEILSAADQSATTAMRLTGSSQDQEIYGNAGANVLDGGGGTDYMGGLGGNDTYFVSGSGDHIIEAAGQGTRDVVYARASYTLEANQDIEVLAATQQTATTAMSLTGNNLVNELYGNDGANTLNGGAGSDFLMGFGGADIFAFTTTLGAGNVDQIIDFSVADDTIALDDAVFTGLATGALAAGAFVNGSAAADADDRVLYNSATGQILYDADGNGAGAAVLFAAVSAGTVLTASDFTVI